MSHLKNFIKISLIIFLSIYSLVSCKSVGVNIKGGTNRVGVLVVTDSNKVCFNPSLSEFFRKDTQAYEFSRDIREVISSSLIGALKKMGKSGLNIQSTELPNSGFILDADNDIYSGFGPEYRDYFNQFAADNNLDAYVILSYESAKRQKKGDCNEFAWARMDSGGISIGIPDFALYNTQGEFSKRLVVDATYSLLTGGRYVNLDADVMGKLEKAISDEVYREVYRKLKY